MGHDLDSTAGADSGDSSSNDVGTADDLASPIDVQNQTSDQHDDAGNEPAPAASTPQNEFVTVPGFGRVHKDDAAKAKEFVKGAFGAFERATLTEKQIKQIENDPVAWLEQQGFDADNYAQQRLAKKLEESLLSPEQLKMTAQERDYAEREAKLKAREADIEKKQLDELTQREAAQIETSIIDALKSTGLPPRRENLIEMAKVAKSYLARGIDAPWDHVAQIVAEQREFHEAQRMKQTFDESTDEEFDRFMGGMSPKARERARGWFLKQVNSPQNPAAKRPQTNASPQPRKPAGPKRMSEADYRKWMSE